MPITRPEDVLTHYEVRKSKKQKAAFREAVREFAAANGCAYAEEKGSCGSRNVILGDPTTAKHLFTAHYDTCAVLPIPNLITPCNLPAFLAWQLLLVVLIFGIATVLSVVAGLALGEEAIFWTAELSVFAMLWWMLAGPANKHTANDNTSGVVMVLKLLQELPEEKRKDCCFVLFDLEEAGLFGSMSYRKKHKQETNNQMIYNFDCIGEGDDLLVVPNKNLWKDSSLMEKLRTGCGEADGKRISLIDHGFCFYPSDQKNFPRGIAFAAMCYKKGIGYYLGRIHTRRDTVLDLKNLETYQKYISDLL